MEDKVKYGKCINCGKHKAKFVIRWRRRDGSLGRRWKADRNHNTCQKCWRAI